MRSAMAAPQESHRGALELSEQVDDGVVGLVDGEGWDLDRDGANGRSWFHGSVGKMR
jgi:hypothetical protein